MITNFQCARMLARDFNSVPYVAPSTYYVSLSSTPYQLDGTGGTEPVGTNYGRLAISANTIDFTTPINNEVTNKNLLMFPKATSTWGTAIIEVGIYDSLTGGNLLFAVRLPHSHSVPIESVFMIHVGELRIRMVE